MGRLWCSLVATTYVVGSQVPKASNAVVNEGVDGVLLLEMLETERPGGCQREDRSG